MQNVKCDWSISFIQVGKNRTHPIFQKLYHTNICTSSSFEFAILQSQTSWIIQVVSYKSFNARATQDKISLKSWLIPLKLYLSRLNLPFSWLNLSLLFCWNTHNSPVNFKLIYFLLRIKVPYKSPNFKTYKCSGENFPNSSSAIYQTAS